MRRLLAIRRFAICAPLAVTLVMWLVAKQRPGGWDVDPLQAISQITSLLALTGFSISMVIAARNRSIEKIYGGLDKSYKTHGQIAKVSFFVILAHPLLLIPSMAAKGIPWTSLFVPFGPWPAGFEAARAFGVAAYYLFITLVLLTLYRRIEYQQWFLSHKFMGFAYTCAAVHAHLAASDIRAHAGLHTWMLFVDGAGVLAWVYKAFLYGQLAQQYDYTVESLNTKGHRIYEIVLRPKLARMNYEPGEFAFLKVLGNQAIPPESHPFSISSSPAQHQLRFSYREVGDYTGKLKNLQPGDKVRVFGPYGEFTSYVLDEHKRQVWVAGGIGVTPFLSMLAHEATNGDNKEVWLYYSTVEPEERVYHDEAQSLAEQDASRLHYVPHSSKSEGFLSVDRFEEDLGSLAGTAFLFCGPAAMMQNLKRQLQAKGVPAENVFFEDFNFV